MNTNFEMAYLSGGDKYFGPNFGGATIQTLTRKGYSEECSNVGTLLSNLKFSLSLENQMMSMITDGEQDPAIAAKDYLKRNPKVLDSWLKGVTTIDGKEGLAAVKEHLTL